VDVGTGKRLHRLSIALLTVALGVHPISAGAESARHAPVASQTPSIDHFFYGQPAHPAAVASPALAVAPAAPPATAALGPASREDLQPRSIDHFLYGQPAHSAPTAILSTTPAPAVGPTAVAAISPPSAAAVSPATATVPGDHGAEGMRLYLSDPISATSSSFNWSVIATKSHHEIQVYYKRRLYKTYRAVFGRSRFAGPKQYEGDRRTPEGNYLIVSKHHSARFRWFLKINYPNAVDQENFARLRADGDIPRGLNEGGAVGIHGTDLPILNSGNVDWTTGCVSVDNADISELERLLPLGTLVVIKP
jgi:lipoprotein-anchoring transpeptidase ErfK/SrfK